MIVRGSMFQKQGDTLLARQKQLPAASGCMKCIFMAMPGLKQATLLPLTCDCHWWGLNPMAKDANSMVSDNPSCGCSYTAHCDMHPAVTC